MGILFVDQGALVQDSGFRNRVIAGCQSVAVSVTAPAATGNATHMALGNAIIKDADFATSQFCWYIVNRPQVSSIDQITDTQITNSISAYWDQVANAMIGGP